MITITITIVFAIVTNFLQLKEKTTEHNLLSESFDQRKSEVDELLVSVAMCVCVS